MNRDKTHVRAVDNQRGAGDVSSRGREQERRRRRNLVDPPVSLQRDLLEVLLEVLLQQKGRVSALSSAREGFFTNPMRERFARALGTHLGHQSVHALRAGDRTRRDALFKVSAAS